MGENEVLTMIYERKRVLIAVKYTMVLQVKVSFRSLLAERGVRVDFGCGLLDGSPKGDGKPDRQLY